LLRRTDCLILKAVVYAFLLKRLIYGNSIYKIKKTKVVFSNLIAEEYMEEEMGKSVAKTVGLVMIITMLCRVMGLLSNQVYMTFFGVSTEIDIYSYAVNFQLYVINCLGTAIITVMIPMFAGFIGTGEKKRAYKFADNVITLSFVLAAILAVLGILFSPEIVKLTHFNTPEYFDFAVKALRIMFPVLIFYTLTYTLQGILQAQGSFLVPASISLYNSIAIILYVFFLGDRFGVIGLLIATLIGLSLQALVQIPAIYRTEYRYRPSFSLMNPDILNTLKLVPPILISSSAYQINMIYNLSTASKFENTVALVVLGQNLVLQAVLALAISMTSVMFPRLTTMVAKGDMSGFKQSVIKLLKTMIFLILPMTIGLAAVSRETIGFIYGYGKFTNENIIVAAKIVALYSIGGVGLGIKEVTDKAFYSLKDTMKPAIVGIVMMVSNILMSLILLPFMGVYAIPASYSIAGIMGGLSGVIILRRKVGPFGLSSLYSFAIKTIISTGAMIAVVLPLAFLFENILGRALFPGTLGLVAANLIKLFVPVGVGVVVFFVLAIKLEIKEAVETLDKIKGKIRLKKV